jgi:hypothetical protein
VYQRKGSGSLKFEQHAILEHFTENPGTGGGKAKPCRPFFVSESRKINLEVAELLTFSPRLFRLFQ